jgi:hypothetical protein
MPWKTTLTKTHSKAPMGSESSRPSAQTELFGAWNPEHEAKIVARKNFESRSQDQVYLAPRPKDSVS